MILDYIYIYIIHTYVMYAYIYIYIYVYAHTHTYLSIYKYILYTGVHVHVHIRALLALGRLGIRRLGTLYELRPLSLPTLSLLTSLDASFPGNLL